MSRAHALATEGVTLPHSLSHLAAADLLELSVALQGDRYSLAYFANARASTIFQGPAKKYPPITFAEILEKKSNYTPEHVKGREMTDEELLAMYRLPATGPEFQPEHHADVLPDQAIAVQ